MKINLKNQKGFTIIEVLIVLAIAGLIMLIVFLAVPALQRNARNTQRSTDSAKLVSAINECIANNNGKLTTCNTLALLDPQYITMADNGQITTIAAAPSVTAATFVTGAKCDTGGAAGATTTAGVGARSFAITYQVESNNGTPIGRCISS